MKKNLFSAWCSSVLCHLWVNPLETYDNLVLNFFLVLEFLLDVIIHLDIYPEYPGTFFGHYNAIWGEQIQGFQGCGNNGLFARIMEGFELYAISQCILIYLFNLNKIVFKGNQMKI